MPQYIDAAGLTQAPVDLTAYIRALGLSGYIIPPEHRLSVLRQMHSAGRSDTVYTGPAGASYWRLASPTTLIRIVPGDREMNERILDLDPALYYLMEHGGLSRAKAQAILARKTTTPAREEAGAFTSSFLATSEPPQLPYIGDSPPTGVVDRNPYTYREVSDVGGIVALANSLAQAKDDGSTVGLDVEGTSEDDRTAELVGVGIAIGTDTFYAPTDSPLADAARALLVKHLPGLHYIAHNAKYDYKMMKRAGFPIDQAILAGDGMIAAYVLAEVDERGVPQPKGLKPLAARLLGEPLRTFKEVLAGAKDAREVPVEVLGPYCASDAYWCVKVEERLRECIVERGIRMELYKALELPNVLLLAEMELLGLPVDIETTKLRREQYQNKVARGRLVLQARAADAGWTKTGESTCKHKRPCKCAETLVPFNPGSLVHLDELLRGIWALPRMGYTTTGQASYNEDAMLLLRERVKGTDAEAFVTGLLTWRGDSKVLSTYLDAFVGKTVEGYIHPNYNQTVVESGRLSSDDPNAQNIPLDLRDLFVAPPGYYIWCADHSQLELRILARVSGCRAMVEAYQNDTDIHALTAWRVFGISPQNLTPEMRVRAKTLNFGIAYEASPDAVLKQIREAALKMPELGLSVPTYKDCELLVREFFRAYPEVPQAVAFHHAQTRQLGYSSTMYGRRRYLPNINHPAQELRQRAERQAWNLVIQGTAGDIMKAGQLVVYRQASEHKADVRCQVHDELWGLVSGETWEEWLVVVAQAMVLDQPLQPVPLKVEPKVGKNWKAAK